MIDAKSTSSASTSNGTLPTACTASVCINAPLACAAAAISLIGCNTPISLFAAITLTSAVRSVMASITAVQIDDATRAAPATP